ncbi:MAG: hypothetical protein H6669_06965 [Ardenticatenaceae bacterium]|nr:hypothetical protein [Ardenticatenaceae bacterium]
MVRWRRFFTHKQNLLGLLIVGLIIVVAIAAPRLSPPIDPENPGPYNEYAVLFADAQSTHHGRNILGTVPQTAAPAQRAHRARHLRINGIFITRWFGGHRSALRFGLVVTGLTAVFRDHGWRCQRFRFSGWVNS